MRTMRIVEDITRAHLDHRFGVEVQHEEFIPGGLFSSLKPYVYWALVHHGLTREQAEAIIANSGSKWKVI